MNIFLIAIIIILSLFMLVDSICLAIRARWILLETTNKKRYEILSEIADIIERKYQ